MSSDLDDFQQPYRSPAVDRIIRMYAGARLTLTESVLEDAAKMCNGVPYLMDDDFIVASYGKPSWAVKFPAPYDEIEGDEFVAVAFFKENANAPVFVSLVGPVDSTWADNRLLDYSEMIAHSAPHSFGLWSNIKRGVLVTLSYAAAGGVIIAGFVAIWSSRSGKFTEFMNRTFANRPIMRTWNALRGRKPSPKFARST